MLLYMWVSGKMMNNFWVHDFNIREESENNHISSSAQKSYDFTVSDHSLSSMFLVDMQNNIENDNPNSMKSLSGYPTTYEIDLIKSKSNLETIPHKDKLVVKGPRSKRCRRTVFGGPWSFKAKYKDREVTDFTSTPMALFDSIDKTDPTFKIQRCGYLENDYALSESFGRYVETKSFHSGNNVARWLEDVGFGRYAGVFEMHEVDEEALPLLTFEDLKEMGVIAVGPRRKLYAAICRLRDGRTTKMHMKQSPDMLM